MKALILGGCGFVGSSVARDLLKSNDFAGITLADVNDDLGRVAPSVRHSGKITTLNLDTTDLSALARAMPGHDIVVNCVGPFAQSSIDVLKTAIEAGINYADVCDDAGVTRQLFQLDDDARRAGITAITGLGSSPGTTNMLARYGIDKLDAVAEVEIYFVIALIDPIGRAGLTQAMGQFAGTVIQYLDGQLVEVPAGSGATVVDFMEPFGPSEAYFARHPESFTLPHHFPQLRRATNRGTFFPPVLPKLFQEFIQLGLLSPELVMVGESAVAARDFMVSFMRQNPGLREKPDGASLGVNVVVRGRKGGSSVTLTYRGSAWGGPITGIPAATGIRMLHQGGVTAKGVVAPEAAFDPQKYLLELAGKGLRFYEQETLEHELKL